MNRRGFIAVATLAAAGVSFAAEPLLNASLDVNAKDGRTPADWTLPKDCKTEYREIAHLSKDFVMCYERTTPGLLLAQKLSVAVEQKDLVCTFTAVFPGEPRPVGWEVREGLFRLFAKTPMTVQINQVSLQNRAPRQSLKLVTREALPKAEGELAGRKLHVFAKTKSPQRVLLFTDDLCADWIAEDLEKQFGFRTDVIWRGQTWEPETVQARFDRGEYVLFLPGANPITLEKTPHSAIAEYIRRGGRAVYVSPRRGGTWGRPIPFPEGIPYDRISPKGLKDYGIACLSSGPLGQGTVVELGLNVRISRSGIWPSVDEVF
ncbi:MAG: hypothetical protein PHN85_11610, partial [Kiritimatiellae bacterium]|nr:hypothetical protein [Kiritimatiellia bacterium]